MFDSSTFTQEMLSNPSKLSKAIIDAMEASDTGPVVSINDPNNGFVMQMFANNAIFSKFSEKVDYINSFWYPQRARNAEQLYPHLSEFDYVNLMASPVTVPFVFAMSKNWIIENAVYFDTNYNKIQIPATSYITMGGIIYSMYYPIDILVNRNTGAVTAFYNTDKTNSLYTLDSNMLLDVREYYQNGLNWFRIQFNMFQFERKILSYTVGSEQGFIRTIPYEDQFYAAKVFTLLDGGEWKELAYSLTQMYYDYQTPTALLTMLTDTSEVKIEIPQIYFDNNQISQTIKVELYTSKGAVNYSLSAADVTGLKANFDTGSSSYAAPLAQMPSWTIVPTVVEVEGGSDAMGYAEIRDAVVNQRLHDRVAITTAELIQAARKAGFDQITRTIDDLTERMYFASNVLVDSTNMVVPTFTGSILIADEALEADPSTIINYTDGYYTILPTTTFKIANRSLTCTPMTNGEVAAFQLMTKQSQVDELNKGNYVRQPFHVTLLTAAKSPAAAIYNLLSPTMTSLAFIRENAHSAPQMSITSCSLVHLNNGTGGYQIRMSATRSSNIEEEAIGNFSLILTCKTKIGEDVYFPATYIGTDSYGNDVWEIILATNYHITTDDHLTVMMFDASDTLSAVEIPLDQTFNVLSTFISSFDATVPVDAILNGLLPISYSTTQVAMSQQELKVTFGQNLSNQIYCGVNTSWGNDVYDLADETVYFKNTTPIFQTNETGVIETRFNSETDAVEVVIIYPQNSTPASTGDITVKTISKVNPNGNPAAFVVDDITGLLVGMKVRGTNIPVGSTITAINVGTKTITISEELDVAVDAETQIIATNPHLIARVSAAQTVEGVALTIEDTSDLIVGQSVFGFGIPQGATVANIQSATVFHLSDDTTEVVGEDTLLTFINTTAHGVVKIAKGEVLTDGTGAPIVVKAAQNQYRIPAILFDGRLFASDEPTDMLIVNTIAQKLQNYANQIYTIDEGLIEDSDVFYKPARTMGLATFGIGNNETVSIPLSLGFDVIVYVDVAVYNTATLLSTMKAAIFSIINEEIQQPTISVSDIATTIKEKLGANVSAVEMRGISGDENLRLIALEDSDATPGIEYKLSLQADGSIGRAPNINVTFIPKPETTDMVAASKL